MALTLPNTIANGEIADGDKLGQNLQTIVSFANNETITRDGSTAMVGPLLLAGAPTQPNQAATKGYVDNRPQAPGAPVGAMVIWHNAVAVPTNWLLCNGSLVSRVTYAELFAVIGTTYGLGDGTTSFPLPPANGYVPNMIIRAIT